MHRLLLAMPLLFAVPASAQPSAAQPADTQGKTETASADSPVICKRFARTGSLVSRYKECKTKWEWDRERELLQTLKVSDSCRTRGEPSSGPGC